MTNEELNTALYEKMFSEQGDKLYGGNLADCHRPSQRGDTEVPERTKRAITVKTGWESQAVSLHSRSKRQ